MSRPLRLELAGGLYHITSRGNRRENIYLDNKDPSKWLELLGQICERYNWQCHAWCLMTNHYHFVVETVEDNLSQGMRQLNGVYTQYFNHVHHRVGHIFQGRYIAILVDKDSYCTFFASSTTTVSPSVIRTTVPVMVPACTDKDASKLIRKMVINRI